jgi:UDP-galactopyranose mutase
LAERSGVLFGGRLATYRYFDMHQVVGQALATARREFGEEPNVANSEAVALRIAA